MTPTPRKGARIQRLIAYVAEHPGCTAAEAIRACAQPKRNGYVSVHRAIAAGWIRCVRVAAKPYDVMTLWVA